MEKAKKTIKIIFGIRILLWIVAFIATMYWAVWSFKIYAMGIYDAYEYAAMLRPVITKGLIISVVCIVVCFVLRHISDTLKQMYSIH